MSKKGTVSRIRDICARKHKGNTQSLEANQALSPFKAKIRLKVRELIRSNRHGLTRKDVARLLKKAVHEISGRITEPLADQEIYTAGKRKQGSRNVGVLKAYKEAA